MASVKIHVLNPPTRLDGILTYTHQHTAGYRGDLVKDTIAHGVYVCNCLTKASTGKAT